MISKTTEATLRVVYEARSVLSDQASNYRICARCIMDTSDPDILFDDKRMCNHCTKYFQKVREELFTDSQGQARLERLLGEIKAEGKGKEYDCIIGVSGGVDSTLTAYTVKRKLGLRPLAVHLDNGWNSELAVHNVEHTLKILGIDLYTYVLDWEEFRDLQLSFLKASVANSEAPTDHAIVSILYHMAAKTGVRHILTGSNIVSEGMHLPSTWGYNALDWRQVKGIHRRFGRIKLKSFPHLSAFQLFYYTFVKRFRFIPILNYFHYAKEDAKKMLAAELGWRDYGGKHHDSIYTRFYQAYVTQRKFHFDKRRVHLSNLICSGQMTREEALHQMNQDPYPRNQIIEDEQFVLKKLGLSKDEFEAIMDLPIVSHKDYPSNSFLFERMPTVVKRLRKIATSR
jgi:N-acetyl sugar amidotransferase